MVDEFYCTVDSAKIAANINVDDTKHDISITDKVNEAHNFITNVLRPYADVLPIPPGSPYYRDAVDITKFYILAHWNLSINQNDRYESYKENYEARLDTLIKSYRADSTERTQDVIGSVNRTNERLVIPSEKYSLLYGVRI